MLFDLKIENLTYKLLGDDYILDLGIFNNEVDLEGHNQFYYRSSVADQGDLSTYYAYKTFDATGYTVVPPKVAEVTQVQNPMDLLKDGVAYIKTGQSEESPFVDFPLILVDKKFELGKFRLQPGMNPTYFLKKDGKLTHALINGFLIDLSKPLDEQYTGNGLTRGN